MANREGRFRLRAPPFSRGAVRLFTRSEERQLARHEPIEWGVSDVVLEATSVPPLTLELRHAKTGEPIRSRVFVRWEPVDPGHTEMDQSLTESPKRDGSVNLPHVRPGENRFRLRFEGAPPMAATAVVRHVPANDRTTMPIAIEPSTAFEVVVVDRQGQPIAGAEIHMAASTPPDADFPDWLAPGFLGYATTDESGQARVWGAEAGHAVDIKVRAKDHQEILSRNFLVGSSAPCRIVLKPR